MTSRNLDPVLARQLKRLALPAELQGSAEWERFLDSINEHYVHMNDDRALLSRSIELSTQEMDGLRRRLEAQGGHPVLVLAGRANPSAGPPARSPITPAGPRRHAPSSRAPPGSSSRGGSRRCSTAPRC